MLELKRTFNVSWRRQYPRPVELFGPLIIVALLGLMLDGSRFGDALARLSFDVPFVFRPDAPPGEVLVVTMDELTYKENELNAKYNYPYFDRSTHARFLDKLKADGAPLVVFDIFFEADMPEDEVFGTAIKNHGNVILAAEVEAYGDAEYSGFKTNLPAAAFEI